jgi:hypothetical protein
MSSLSSLPSSTMGYPSSIFLNNVFDNLSCSICLCILKDPVHCRDDHHFCRSCLENCLKFKRACPVCRIDMKSTADVFTSRGINDLILQLTVKCYSTTETDIVETVEDGNFRKKARLDTAPDSDSDSDSVCTWTGQLHALQAHLKNDCPLTIVTCKYPDCNVRMQRRHLGLMHEDACPFRREECPYCKWPILMKDSAGSIHFGLVNYNSPNSEMLD